MTDGGWMPFSPYALGQSIIKNMMSLPELSSAILKQAGRAGIYDDMTVIAFQILK
jgi:hypothetical protein